MKPIRGIFVAPSLGAFIATFAMCLSPEVAPHQFLGVLFLYSIVGAIFGIISAVIFGWPIAKVFQHYKLVKSWHFLLGGFVCSIPFWLAWFYPFNTGHWDSYKVVNSLYFFGVGAFSGIIYWYLVIRGVYTNKARQCDASHACSRR